MRWLRVAALLGAISGFMGASGPAVAQRVAPASGEPGLIRIADVQVRIVEQGPVVLLMAEGKAIPIFVDLTVAGSIQGALTGQKLPRPMSHDLMHTIMETYGGRVTRTVITLKEGTYYGALSVTFNGEEKVFDSRSSDSIALAVHFKAPILVPRDLLESAGKVLPESKKQEL